MAWFSGKKFPSPCVEGSSFACNTFRGIDFSAIKTENLVVEWTLTKPLNSHHTIASIESLDASEHFVIIQASISAICGITDHVVISRRFKSGGVGGYNLIMLKSPVFERW